MHLPYVTVCDDHVQIISLSILDHITRCSLWTNHIGNMKPNTSIINYVNPDTHLIRTCIRMYLGKLELHLYTQLFKFHYISYLNWDLLFLLCIGLK